MRRLAVALLLVWGGEAWGATYYVDAATGNDADSGLTEALAFATPRGCVLAMNGGDTCLIKNGTYVANGGDWYIPGFNFCERDISGTAEAYTTIKSFSGHAPKFCSSADCSNNNTNPTLGVYRASGCGYLRFEGLEVDGSLMVMGAPGGNVHHITVTGSNFYGGTDCGGNYTPVHVRWANNIQFDHNHVHGLKLPAGGCGAGVGGASGMITFCMSDSTLEYNTFTNDGADSWNQALHLKDSAIRDVLRFNNFSGPSVGEVWLNNQNNCGVATASEVYGNVFGGSLRGLVQASNFDIHHNTLLSGFTLESHASAAPFTGTDFRNNLVQNGSVNSAISTNHWVQAGTFDFDYNFYRPAGTFIADRYGPTAQTCFDLNCWRTRLQAAGCVGCEASSQWANVTFAAGPDTPYHLACGGSPNPCTSSSTTPGGEVGAYGVTTCVGRTCAGGGLVACNDTLDNDLDGKTDYHVTPGVGDSACLSAAGTTESVCGDNFKDAGEDCDGTAMGAGTCITEGFEGQVPPGLTCAGDCTYDTANCRNDCEPIPRATWVASANSEQPNVSQCSQAYPAADAIDTDANSLNSFWHTEYTAWDSQDQICEENVDPRPHRIQVDLGAETDGVCGFDYRQRGDGGVNGNFWDWEFRTCAQGADCAIEANWTLRAFDSWDFEPGNVLRTQRFTPVNDVRQVRLVGLRTIEGDPPVGDGEVGSAADFTVRKRNLVTPTPCAVHSLTSVMTGAAGYAVNISENCGADIAGMIQLGDSANHATATLVTQPKGSWVNGKAVGTINLGAFGCSTPLWLFVTSAGGSQSEGFAVTACAAKGQTGVRRILGGG